MKSPKTQTGNSIADLTNESPLADRIRATAHKLAYRYGAEVADVESIMTIALLEQYTEDPDWLSENTLAFITSYAAWAARDAVKRECRFDNRQVSGDATVDDDSSTTLFDLIPSNKTWADCEQELVVEQALETLEEEDRLIAQLYAVGYSVPEIAEKIGIARRTVYWRMNHRIHDALVMAGL